MSVEYRIISIGTTSHHLLWGETVPVRTQHATITLVVSDSRRILVDPSLPAPALEARFFERTGRRLDSVTDVFCTTLRPDARRGLPALRHARWWCSREEREGYVAELQMRSDSFRRLDGKEEEESRRIEEDLAAVERFHPAPEKFTEHVQLYPLFGATAGSAGLLLTPPTATIVIAGPAAPTREHIEQGVVWEHSADRDRAKESLADLLELADVIVPGFDDLFPLPRCWM